MGGVKELGGAAGGVDFAAVVAVAAGEEREGLIQRLVAGMSLEEKLGQMGGSATLLDFLIMIFRYNFTTYDAGQNDRLGIPPIKFTDGPRGVALGHSTCFPVSMARGAAWDPELEARIGDAIGVEARSQGANYFGGVCVNLVRHPGWGRAQESYGEDPHLLGALGVALARGVQRHAMACAKHFALNSIEEARFFVDVKVDERTLHEVYLPHFKKLADAGVASFMSAYNKVNGKFCGHNEELLLKILKGRWNWPGFVISDFILAVRGPTAARAGTDIEMPFTLHFGRRLKRAVKKGAVPEAAIDAAVTRIIRQKARFAKKGEPGRYGKDRVACPEHRALALEAARKSIVLLQNRGGALPLARERVKTLAVIGELAATANLGDRGSSAVHPPRAVTLLEGLRQVAGPETRVVYDVGLDLGRAWSVARDADAVVVAAGLSARDEGESIPGQRTGGDREDLRLDPRQEAMIKAVAMKDKPVAVVLFGGSAIITEAWRDLAPAILMAWYPGMEGGRAIAETLFGDHNPSAKLPLTFPRSHDQLPFFDRKARELEYGYYHGYRLFEKKGREPAFAFGHGLSYSRYRYQDLRLDRAEAGMGETVTATVTVENLGPMAGEEVVQLYVSCPGSAVDRPVKELKGFARVVLAPGEKQSVSIPVPVSELGYYDVGSGAFKVEAFPHVVLVGPSSRDEELLRASLMVKAR